MRSIPAKEPDRFRTLKLQYNAYFVQVVRDADKETIFQIYNDRARTEDILTRLKSMIPAS